MVTFTDVIDSYANGDTGTITLPGGDTVGYTVDTNILSQTAFTGGGFVGSTVVYARPDWAQYFTVTLDDPVANMVVAVTAGNAGDAYQFIIDGVVVDLATLEGAGLITINYPDAGHLINANGELEGDGGATTDITYIQFNYAVTSIRIGAGTDAGGPLGVDFFEVGISDVAVLACFCSGTLIETETGPQAVERLKPGERILTKDDTYSELLCVLGSKVSRTDQILNPKLRPVKIAAAALGRDLPSKELRVSPQHRMIVSSKISERICGSKEVLVAALRLTDIPGIEIDTSLEETCYFHLVFDSHKIIFADGAPTESFFLGEQAIKALPREAFEEVSALFSDILLDNREIPRAASPIPPLKKQRQLVARHIKNKKELLSREAEL